MSKKIKLTKGKYAIVDDDDFNFISRLKPVAMKRVFRDKSDRNHGRCWEVILPGGKGVCVYYVKHFLLRAKNANMVVEAKNGNNLDLRKSNLTIISREVCSHHNRKRLNTSSKYEGVCYIKNPAAKNKWGAAIKQSKKRRHIGVFATEKEAAIAYNERAKKLYGNLAYQNKI